MNNTIKKEYLNPPLILYKCKGIKENKLNSRDYNNATNITLHYQMNDVDELTFNIPWSEDRKISYDDCEKLIKFQDRYFIIKNISLTDDSVGEMTVTCQSEETELKGIECQTIDLIGVTPEKMFNTIMSKTLFPELLTQYHWKGTDVPSTKLRQLQVDSEVSVYENLVSMADVFGGWLEFTFDLDGGKWIFLRTQSINNKKYLKKSLDLEKLNLEYDSDEIFTRLRVFGATNSLTNEPLNIINVNPTGKAYLEDYSYYLNKGIPESVIKSEAKYLQMKTITLDDYIDEQKLYETGLEELKKYCIPQLTASLDINDLSVFEENDGLIEPPKVGYTITCVNKNTNFILSCMVTDVKRNIDKPSELTVEIANYIKYDTVLQSLEKTSTVVSNTVTKNTDGEKIVQGNAFVANGEDLVNKVKNINVRVGENSEQLNAIVSPSISDIPIVTFVDDDCQKELLTVTKPIYDSNRIKVTLGVITDKVNSSGYLTLDELKTLYEDGYELVSHSKTHSEDYFFNDIKNTPNEIYEQEFKDSKQWFKNNGFEEIDTIIYPFANFDYGQNDNINSVRIKNIAKKYYKYGMNADGNYNESPNDNIYLNRFFLDKSNFNIDFVKRIIDEVFSQNGWLIIGLHSWSTTQINQEFLNDVITYIKSKNIAILTFNEAKRIKANVISIGDFTNEEKGFFIGNDGKIINRSEKIKIIDKDWNANLNYTIDKFLKNKLTLMEIQSVNDSLTGFGGILLTYNGSNSYCYQTYITINGTKIYNRMWDYNTNKWIQWTDITSQNYNIIQGVKDINIDAPITNYDIYKETIIQVDSIHDTFLHIGGVMKIFRGDDYYCYSLFYPLNENKVYKRTWNVSESKWNDFSQIQLI